MTWKGKGFQGNGGEVRSPFRGSRIRVQWGESGLSGGVAGDLRSENFWTKT
jgi:hypothetical protein